MVPLRRIYGAALAVFLIGQLGELDAATQPPPRLAIGEEHFAPSDIVDARAQPEPDGTAAILVTLEELAAERLQRVSRAHLGRALAFSVDGKTLMEPIVHEPLEGGRFVVAAHMSPEEARAMALAISGKPPLPESLEE